MGTSAEDGTFNLGSKSLHDYAWWKFHVAFFVSAFLVFPIVMLANGLVSGLWEYFGVYDVVRAVSNVILQSLFFVIFPVTYVGSLVGYYYDSIYVESLDVDYSPLWWLYVILHVTFIFGAIFAVPLYIVQRLRHVGIPLFT